MGEAFTRHSLRPLDSFSKGMSLRTNSGAIRRENAMACPLLFEM
jgi:hypothetical protein